MSAPDSGSRPRIAFVTGGAQGLGAAIARRLSADGFRVAIGDINTAAGAALASDLDATGNGAAYFELDVSDVDSIGHCLDAVTDTWQMPDVLINNAGRTVKRSVWDITVAEWDDIMATNLRSYFVTSQRCAPSMRDNGWGRIVNISSFAGQQGGMVAGAHYAASKAGSIVLTKIFARELAASGITVNAVAPAAILTPAMGGPDDPEVVALAQNIPVGRVGRADEVAAAVAYLVGPDSGYVTGTTLDVNGGMFMR